VACGVSLARNRRGGTRTEPGGSSVIEAVPPVCGYGVNKGENRNRRCWDDASTKRGDTVADTVGSAPITDGYASMAQSQRSKAVGRRESVAVGGIWKFQFRVLVQLESGSRNLESDTKSSVTHQFDFTRFAWVGLHLRCATPRCPLGPRPCGGTGAAIARLDSSSPAAPRRHGRRHHPRMPRYPPSSQYFRSLS
jgi:hypothetical protein